MTLILGMHMQGLCFSSCVHRKTLILRVCSRIHRAPETLILNSQHSHMGTLILVHACRDSVTQCTCAGTLILGETTKLYQVPVTPTLRMYGAPDSQDTHEATLSAWTLILGTGMQRL